VVAFWLCLLAALPPDEASGPATLAAAPGWSTVTYALQRPPTDADEVALLGRLPAWDAAFGFSRYAIPLATPTAGGDLAGQLARVARLAAAVGPARLVAITPPVGNDGWETSHNLAWLPLGGRPALVATARETWFAALNESAAGGVALCLEGLAAEPTVEQLGGQIDALLAGCAASGQQAELWLPAAWAAPAAASPMLAVLTPDRVAALRRVLWLDVELQLPTPALPLPGGDQDAPLPPSGGVEPAPAPAPAAEAVSAEVTVPPTAVRAAETMASLLGALAERTPRGYAGIDLVDSPRRPLARVEAAQEYLAAARQVGFAHLLVRGRLDTPQAPLWRELMVGLTKP